MNKKNMKLSFAAIDPVIENYKVLGTEKELPGCKFVTWGDDNKFPTYLYNLYMEIPTLKAAIDSVVDYVTGDNITIQNSLLSDEDMLEVVTDMARSYAIYGGFAINILRNRLGDIAKLCVMDFKRLRTSKDGKIIYYSEDYDSKSYGRIKYRAIEAFDPSKKQENSIYYFKNSKYTTYPIPIYNAAITACEIERSIGEYHLNSINNGFTGSVIINLNNGVPDEEIQEEIERNFQEKFTGKDNAGRIVIAYSDNKDNAATIEKIETEDFSARYESLAKHSKQSIFTAFRMTPTLAGIPTENNGFSSEQYKEQFVLFNKTTIQPIQKIIVKELNKILGTEITIEPFIIDFEDTDKNNTII